MKPRASTLVLLLQCALATVLHAREPEQPATPKELLQQGLFAEEAEQKLDAAVESYEKIVALHDSQRGIVATALFRLAEVRRKQGRTGEAIASFRRLLVEFGDVEPQAGLSREKLELLGEVETADAAAKPGPEEQKELNRLETLARNSPERIPEIVVWKETTLGTVARWRPNVGRSSPTRTRRSGPLSRAAMLGWLHVSKWLLDHGVDPNDNPVPSLGSPLYAAASHNQLAVCRLLIERGADVRAAGSAVVKAVDENFTEVAELLIEKGASIDEVAGINIVWDNNAAMIAATPLTTAIARDNPYWTDKLLELGAKLNVGVEKEIFTALHLAAWKGYAPLVKRLLESGADANAPDALRGSAGELRPQHLRLGEAWTPIFYAIGNPKVTAALLEGGAKVDAAESGLTPLHCACHVGNTESVRLVIAAGADVSAQVGKVSENPKNPSYLGVEGATPLHMAIPRREASLEAVEILVRAGARLDLADGGGRTPLHLAVASGRTNTISVAITRHLLEAGAPVDAPDLGGQTPLLSAYSMEEAASDEEAVKATAAVVDLLLQHDADPEIVVDGKPVFHAAILKRRMAVMRERIYPRLAKEKAVHLARTGRNLVEVLQSAGENAVLPKSLAELLVRWGNPEPRVWTKDQPYTGFLSIWRKSGEAPMEQIEVDAGGGQPLPVLRWGDVVEWASFTPDPVWKSRPDEGWRERRSAREKHIMEAPNPSRKLRNYLERKVTVRVGELERTLTLRGSVSVYDPLSESAPLVSARDLARLAVGGFPMIQVKSWDFKVERNGASVLEADIQGKADIHLESGDLVVVAPGERSPVDYRGINVSVVVPGHLRGSSFTAPDGMTLFQLLVLLYHPIETELAGLPRVPSLEELEGLDVEALEEALTNSSSYYYKLISWPNWAAIRIHRLVPGAEDEVIAVDLSPALAAAGPELSVEKARSFDVLLEAGDIVELPVHADRKAEEWPGLSEAMARLIQKALTMEVVLAVDGAETATSLEWMPPRWVRTSRGLLPIPTGIAVDGKVQGFDFRAVHRSVAPGTGIGKIRRGDQEFGHSNFFVRDGDVLELSKRPPQGGVSTRPGVRPSVPSVSTPANSRTRRRSVVLPPSRQK